MEARAHARYVRLAPRKARAVVDLIRKKNVDEALSILRYTPRLAAEVVSKVVRSAAANAENNHELNRSALYVDQAFVDEGPALKRVQPRARGRRFMILKRTSHITVIVKERKGV
ncbi:MAG TPA: 50S ribosomal protein L22 [Candidatus Limnocylindrales bacterium]|nr:50S ribosomal protein L22 [Candidatus Limnocylindrales bacterium]